jgi:predicted O-methyltransferase YrrM
MAWKMIERVEQEFPGLRYMKPVHANFLRDLIREYDLDNLLELGTAHGKGTAYMALIQEERGRGHVTTLDRDKAASFSPNVDEVVAKLGVAHRVTIKRTPRSYTHTLMQMLEEQPRPIFDFVYLDGAHTWDGTGFAFFLTDMLLRPGGWVVFDDLDWTLAVSEAKNGKPLRGYADYSKEERETPLVRKVWELLVPAAGYVNRREWKHWGIAQKPQ